MESSRPIYVVGAGGLAKEAAQLLTAVNDRCSQWTFAGFIGADPSEVGRDLTFGTVVGDDDWLLGSGEAADLVIGVGSPKARAAIAARYGAAGGRFSFPTLVHPTAQVDNRYVSLGVGNLITAGCVFTCDIRVGDFNLFNLNVTVGHDVVIGRNCVFNPTVNISGQAKVGDRVLIGTGAQVLEGLTVSDDATVGAGAVVTKDVAPGLVVVGIPARAWDRDRTPS